MGLQLTNQRTNLHDVLVEILGTTHVYFQPPESVKLEYPCIVYKLDKLDAKHANNQKYAHLTRYQVTTIDRNPDGQWQLALFNLPLCAHTMNFATEGLNHNIFELYY